MTVLRRFTRRKTPTLTNKGAFFMALIHDGFLRHSAATFDGCRTMPARDESYYPDFQTVLQAGGDMICKIDRGLLRREDTETLLRSYTAARETLMQG